MTNQTTQPAPDRVWVVAKCDRRCALHEEKTGSRADYVLSLYNQPGATQATVVKGLADVGITISSSAAARHKNHLQQIDPAEIVNQDTDEPVPVMDFLNAVVARSFGNRKNWKPTISDGLQALKLQQEFGGANPFEEMLNAMAEASNIWGDDGRIDTDVEEIDPDEDLAEDPLDPESEGYA